MTTKIEYLITLTEPLSLMETKILKDRIRFHDIEKVTFDSSKIWVTMPSSTKMEVFPLMASWLDHIGGVETIFSIAKVETHYTDFLDPEVKEMLQNA